MKILQSLTYYYPNISGISVYAKTLSEELVKNKYQVSIISSWHDRKLAQSEVINGVHIHRVPITLQLGKGPIMISYPIHAFKLIKQADVVNCHLPQFESFIICIIAKLLGKKIILTHHTDLSGWRGLSNQVSEFAVTLAQDISGFLADKLIPYTKDYADHSKYLKKFKHKLLYCYPPIKVEPPDNEFKKILKEKIGKADYVIGFSGRIAKQKGIPYLLESISLLEKSLISFKIVFAGPFKNIIGENYFDQIRDLRERFKENIVFLGPLNLSQLSSFYQTIDVLVLPSDDRLESFGIVQVEAMINGCPVIATDLPGARIPIQKTGMGLIIPAKDITKLAHSIIMVLKNKNRFKNKKLKAAKEFQLNNTIDFYTKLYYSLIN